jgi:hypothetical protein
MLQKTGFSAKTGLPGPPPLCHREIGWLAPISPPSQVLPSRTAMIQCLGWKKDRPRVPFAERGREDARGVFDRTLLCEY